MLEISQTLSGHSRERGNADFQLKKDKMRIVSITAFLTTAIVVTLAGCMSNTLTLRNSEHTSDSLAKIDLLGSGGRPSTATEDHYWRWKVKTMQDEPNNNWQTRYGMPYQQHFTLQQLTDFNPKNELADDTGEFMPIGRIKHDQTRLWGETFLHEYQIINVEAKIVDYRLEEEDGDIHLILSDSDGKHTLIAEVPDPKEVGDWARPQVFAVRKWLYDTLGEPSPNPKRPPRDVGIVFVVGVPFFDKIHNAKGEAPNGIEIHPILGISLPDDN